MFTNCQTTFSRLLGLRYGQICSRLVMRGNLPLANSPATSVSSPQTLMVMERRNYSNTQDTLYKSLEVEVRSSEPAVLKSYEWFVSSAARHLGVKLIKSWAPPKPFHKRITLLKSIHIYKKHRVQYEIRTHFHHMKFENITGSTLSTFLEYIQRNVPEGVAMKVTKTRLEHFPSPQQKQITS